MKDICNELDVRSLCHKILQNVSTLLHADRGSLFLVQGEREPSAPKQPCTGSIPNYVNSTSISNNSNIRNHSSSNHIRSGPGPVGCISIEEPARPELSTTPPPTITSPNAGNVVVGSPVIGSTNTGSLPEQSATFNTSTTFIRNNQGCHSSRCLVSKLFDVCSKSTLQEMEKKEEIRIPWGMGIVGFVAESGEPVNIPDAYKVKKINYANCFIHAFKYLMVLFGGCQLRL